MSLFGQTILFCPRCYTQNAVNSVYCGSCGLILPTSQIEYINTITKSARELITQKQQLHSDISRLNEIYQKLKLQKEELEKDSINFKNYFLEQLSQLDKLQAETAIHDLGFYKSRYNFESSDAYRLRLNQIREQQKELIRNKEAAVCEANWTVNGSLVKGRKQVNDTLKLMLFGFNGESDVTIAKVKYNNVFEAEKRINKTFDLINKLGEGQECYINRKYLHLKLEELYLSHEYQEKIYEEKEEQRRIREQIREEEIARREIEKALQDAEREETRYTEALRKARKEVEKVEGEKQAKFFAQIQLLESKLAEVEANKERAKSRAQMTRSGHVYVISNIGSFGENIYKIGMTRRLDPMDRVVELGDASVPFRFDVHAIIYSDDAPTLEHQLHKKFHSLRINQINHRREFFRVSLNEIAEAVREFHGEIEFTLLAEAMEYRKTIAFLQENQTNTEV